jgi:hypothetical protein
LFEMMQAMAADSGGIGGTGDSVATGVLGDDIH